MVIRKEWLQWQPLPLVLGLWFALLHRLLAEKPQAKAWKCRKGRCYLLSLSLQPGDENALPSPLFFYLLVFVIWKGKCTRNNSLQVIGFWMKGLLNCDLSLYLEFANANEFPYLSYVQQDIQFTLLPPDFQKKQQSTAVPVRCLFYLSKTVHLW